MRPSMTKLYSSSDLVGRDGLTSIPSIASRAEATSEAFIG
jgi:hypothetical protein